MENLAAELEPYEDKLKPFMADAHGEPSKASHNNIISTLYRGDVDSFVDSGEFLSSGQREKDLKNITTSLIKGGLSEKETVQLIEYLMLSWGDTPDQEWIADIIEIAKSSNFKREKSVTETIEEWVSVTDGYFSVTDCFNALHSVTNSNQTTFRGTLLRLAKRGIIEKHGNKDGVYRRIDNDVEPVNFLTAPTDDFPLTLPLGVSDYCQLYPGNIVIVAGSKSAGKTAFLLNIVRDNMQRHEIVYLNSEMGDTEFRKRLELFGDPLADWKFNAYHRASNFADLITPGKKIFIVDFLEITSDFWKVAQYIQEIHKKLKEGIAIIALQKSEGKDNGRGGDFSKEKARLYLSLDYLADEKVNRVKITDAKAWRTSENPRGLYRRYKLANGSKFIPASSWEG